MNGIAGKENEMLEFVSVSALVCEKLTFLLPGSYFPTNLVHPFTLRVTGIKTPKHQFSDRSYGKNDISNSIR